MKRSIVTRYASCEGQSRRRLSRYCAILKAR
jgi:hypothetical protein